MSIQLKRAYDPVASSDGYRILVDRLWPRGIKKEELKISHWFQEIAPSNELRSWFDHKSGKFEEFERRYQSELEQNIDHVKRLKSICREHQMVTFVYAAKNPEHNNAVVLKRYLEG